MRIPKYRLHKPTGQGLVEWQGKRHYLGRYNTPESLRRYRAFVAKIMEQAGATEAPGSCELVGELIVAFLRWSQAEHPPARFQQFRSACRFLALECHQVPVRDFRPVDFRGMREKMAEASGWSRKYVNAQCRRVISVFRWAVEHGYCSALVPASLREVAGLRPGKSAARETEAVEPVPLPIVEATIPYLSAQVAAMVQLQMYTGMRAGEVILLRPCDLDTSGEVWVYTPERHKGTWLERGRSALLGPRAQASLVPFLDRPLSAYCFSPAEAEAARRVAQRAARKTRVQPSQAARRKRRNPVRAPRQRYDTHSYGRAIGYGIARSARDGCALPPWTPLQLRHTAGTLIRQAHGLEAAQVMLGHSRADVTQLYAERDLDLGRRVARDFG